LSGTARLRWRCVDLQRGIREEFAVELHERTAGKLLRRLSFTRLQPRPFRPKKDAAAQEAFKTYGPPRLQAGSAA
jgi:transposase